MQSRQQSTDNPLKDKVMVLYVMPGDQASIMAMKMVEPYPQVMVQDATRIHPRPAWLMGVPTVVVVATQRPYSGKDAFQVISIYVNNMRRMQGAQDELVLNTVNQGFRVADKGANAIESSGQPFDLPLGESNHNALNAGTVNFATDDDPRYYQDGKVSAADIQQYNSMRSTQRQRPAQLMPSVLDNGEFVNL